MIKATCPCGATFEINHPVPMKEYDRAVVWLQLHQPCVNALVAEQELSNKIASMRRFTLDNDLAYVSTAVGMIQCKECGFTHQQGEPSRHAADCPNIGIDP